MTPTTSAPAIDIDALSPRDLDRGVAEMVLGLSVMWNGLRWEIARYRQGNIYEFISSIDPYSTDANVVREVEAEIERRGLSGRYVTRLIYETHPDNSPMWIREGPPVDTFKLITATPAQRCRAALKAVMA